MRRILFSLPAVVLAVGVVWAGPVASTSQGTFAGQNVNGNFTLNNLANVQDSTTIPHVEITQAGRPGAGFDFYRFSHAGGIVHLDIDTIPTATNFDTEIGIWTSAGILIIDNDDNGTDIGDGPGLVGGGFNSAAFNLNLLAGDYVVGVAQFNSSFQNGSPFITGTQISQGGTYTLNISANNVVPEPVSLALFGVAAAAAGGFGWRRVRKG